MTTKEQKVRNRRPLFVDKYSGGTWIRPVALFEKEIVWDATMAPDKSLCRPRRYAKRMR